MKGLGESSPFPSHSTSSQSRTHLYLHPLHVLFFDCKQVATSRGSKEVRFDSLVSSTRFSETIRLFFSSNLFVAGILSSRLTQPANPRQPPALMTLAERATIGFLKVSVRARLHFPTPSLPSFLSPTHPLPLSNLIPLPLHSFSSLPHPKADREILTTIPISSRCGSTASIAFLHSLDFPSAPFFQARRLSITIAHCGDTRILLCQTLDGTVLPLTEKHHAEARVEAARLRRFGMGAGGSIVDAFGESRWMGAVENTRR